MAKLSVKIRPNAKRNEVSTLDPLVIRITAAPIEGKANIELIRFLSKTLNLAQSNIKVIHGEHIKQKILEIQGLELAEISELLKKSAGRLL